MENKIERDYYKVLLVGQSGKGKTMSFRNMNPDTTGFINIEDKPLPFKNKFKYHARPTTTIEVVNALRDYTLNPEVDCIVIDSFSAWMDLNLYEARAVKTGWDVWNKYNDEVGKFLKSIKKIKKEIFLTAHYEILGVESVQEKRIKTKGKEWEGLIESQFTLVLYADNKFEGADKPPKYYFNAVLENSSAKCPPDLLGEGVTKIENDSAEVFKSILEFTKIEN